MEIDIVGLRQFLNDWSGFISVFGIVFPVMLKAIPALARAIPTWQSKRSAVKARARIRRLEHELDLAARIRESSQFRFRFLFTQGFTSVELCLVAAIAVLIGLRLSDLTSTFTPIGNGFALGILLAVFWNIVQMQSVVVGAFDNNYERRVKAQIQKLKLRAGLREMSS